MATNSYENWTGDAQTAASHTVHADREKRGSAGLSVLGPRPAQVPFSAERTLEEEYWIQRLDAAGGESTGFLQRSVEFVLALLALIATAPLMALLAIAIRLDSPGPALFWQRRMGKGRRPFWFVKFRTLYADAKQRFPELYRYEYNPEELAELQFKVPHDPRVTRIGRWLRRSTLDELPNFWNVLTGDMAMVGPRPEIPEMFRYYRGEEVMKFSVRPGITGLAQISGRGRLMFHETLRYDLDYVERRSFRLDLHIFVETAYRIVIRDGAF